MKSDLTMRVKGSVGMARCGGGNDMKETLLVLEITRAEAEDLHQHVNACWRKYKEVQDQHGVDAYNSQRAVSFYAQLTRKVRDALGSTVTGIIGYDRIVEEEVDDFKIDDSQYSRLGGWKALCFGLPQFMPKG